VEESLGLTRKHLVYLIVFIVTVLILMFGSPQLQRYLDRTKEAQVREKARVVQLAAEDYAVQNEGIYAINTKGIIPLLPDDNDYLPNNEKMKNAFTGQKTEPVDGQASAPGEIGYDPALDNGVAVGYTITGFGKDKIIITLESGTTGLPEELISKDGFSVTD
jgi:type II secretory pathway pseudopilin PulG